ncbi:MAG: HDIG domain-containing protein [Bacteroidales bacterium]|nr:HDIG domain-containing protein [Bacteroidales bacterium]
MKDFIKNGNPGKKYLFHLGFFIASVFIITGISPREGKFRYEFQKGRPWLQSSLIAPWDFPILKPENIIAKEVDSINRNFTPYFNYDQNVEVQEVKNFSGYLDNLRKSFESENRSLSDLSYNTAKRELVQILSGIYRKGIVGVNDVLASADREKGSLIVLTGRIGEQRKISDVFGQKDAYQFAIGKRDELAAKLSSPGNNNLGTFISSVSFYDFIRPNLFYDQSTSSAVKEKLLKSISHSYGLVQQGELIISRGEIVTESKFRVLESLKSEYEKRLGQHGRWLVLVGRFILIAACYIILYLFMYHHRLDILNSTQKTFFIILVILLFQILTRLMTYLPAEWIFIVPFALIAILIRTFYDSRLALFVHLTSVLLAGLIVPNSFEFIFINLLAGVIAIFSLTNTYKRAKLFFTALMVFLTYSVVYFGIGIMQEGTLANMNWKNYSFFAGNGVLVLLAYPLIFVFEKTFMFLSDATLFELSDTNQPLLRKLADEAPGSFQHSLQVANLAEEAAREIGANHLLVRTGALYHDVGKIVNAGYFIENQSEGFSPHDSLDPLKSAKIIIDHVSEGVNLARKYKLPSQIIDFIQTHHGTSVAYYFFKKYMDQNPRSIGMEKEFSYHGPKPFSKETAIVMMADAVEASSRTITGYSEENISELVERITYLQEQDGQFGDTPLTFRDISEIKNVFVKRLSNIYHARIIYPRRENPRV